jgi:hypothetical protein
MKNKSLRKKNVSIPNFAENLTAFFPMSFKTLDEGYNRRNSSLFD